MTGTSSRDPKACLQASQHERGWTNEDPEGSLSATTFKKLPTEAPINRAIAPHTTSTINTVPIPFHVAHFLPADA